MDASEHQPLVNWKFGEPLEKTTGERLLPLPDELQRQQCNISRLHVAWAGTTSALLTEMDGTSGNAPSFRSSMTVFRSVPSHFTNLNLHYCYFLDCVFGGPRTIWQCGRARSYISHCIFDNRCPKIVDCMNPRGKSYFMPLMQTHFTGGGEMPL